MPRQVHERDTGGKDLEPPHNLDTERDSDRDSPLEITDIFTKGQSCLTVQMPKKVKERTHLAGTRTTESRR
jgi:hypothetical protein